MTIVQKTSAILLGMVFCFFSFQIAHAEEFVPRTCECQISCSLSRMPPNPLSVGSDVRRVGSGLTTQGFLDNMNAGIGSACSNFFSISENEAERLSNEATVVGLVWQAFAAAFGGGDTTYSSRQTISYLSASTIGREIDSDFVLSGGCSSAGEALSRRYTCTNEATGLLTECFCLPNENGDDCFLADPVVDISCEAKNDRGLNPQEFAQSLAAINGTPERTATTCNCSLSWSGEAASHCQNKQWSFPYSDRRTRASIFSEVNLNVLCPGYTTPWTPAGLGDSTVIESRATCSGTAENISATVDDGSGTSLPPFTGSVVCSQTTVDVTTQQNYGPGYEPIAWSFPTDKINALNKVGISGSGTTQVQLLIGRLIKYAVGFLGALALCLVIYSGLRFMLSQGDEGKQEESLKMMLWAGIGIVALLGSYSMVTFVLSILN
jgi:hypothetical protein